MKIILIVIMISSYDYFDDSNGNAYDYYNRYDLIWIVSYEWYYFFVGFYNVTHVIRVNLHSVVAWMSINFLLKKSAICES